MDWVAKRLQNLITILIRGVPLVLLGYLKSSAVLLHAMGSRSFCFCDPCSLRCCLGTQTWVVPVLFRLRRRAQKEASERSILMRSISWLYMRLSKGKLGKTLVLHCCLHLSFPYKFSNSLKSTSRNSALNKSFQRDHFLKNFIASSSYLKWHLCHFPWENGTKEIYVFIGVIFLNSRYLYRCAIAKAQIFVFQISF